MEDAIKDTFKVVVLGEGKFHIQFLSFPFYFFLPLSILTLLSSAARVGKTSITIRFCVNKFSDGQKSTIDATCLEQTVRIQDPNTMQGIQTNSYKLCIWDTAGQEQHHCLNTIYYRGAQGALIVYDITDLDSFAKMSMWVKELRQQCGNSLPIVIVGNKSDLEQNRQIKL